ncbi:MAG: hypothetical protein QF858_01865 [Candidatus Pacebacteria bacterium]|jgi:hypothetical protein|nr:hypothetical protein [Candidatus Paceibacterota bacterium]MDP6659543.1 hypothetical protein [Candidatus Paceibacterota bacterium]|tara:strand:- start:5815 stop:5973 length:159 start_codon:yes stop_codon:yes gene_type:complete
MTARAFAERIDLTTSQIDARASSAGDNELDVTQGEHSDGAEAGAAITAGKSC